VTAINGRPKPEICSLSGRFWVNTLAQGVLRQFTQWPWIEHPTFQLRGGHFANELVPPQFVRWWFVTDLITTHTSTKSLCRFIWQMVFNLYLMRF